MLIRIIETYTNIRTSDGVTCRLRIVQFGGIVPICINFTVFSFVSAPNNKKVCATFGGCHDTPGVMILMIFGWCHDTPGVMILMIFGWCHDTPGVKKSKSKDAPIIASIEIFRSLSADMAHSCTLMHS